MRNFNLLFSYSLAFFTAFLCLESKAMHLKNQCVPQINIVLDGAAEAPTEQTKSATRKRAKSINMKTDSYSSQDSNSPPADNFWSNRGFRKRSPSEGSSSKGKPENQILARSERQRLLNKTPEDVLDANYLSFLRTIPGFQRAEAPEHLLGDPLKEIERLLLEEKLERKANFDPSSMPKGKYAVCSEPTFIVRSVSNERKYKLLTQGWKIHISARPESAQKIAKLVLAVIDDSLHIFEGADGKIKYDHTYFKIVSSLPVMRTMDNVIGNLKGDGRETQAGKFITIYPASKKHAAALVQIIDDKLHRAILENQLTKDDFVSLSGEALIGKSNGVYIRYGNLSSAMDRLRVGIYCSASNTPCIKVKKSKEFRHIAKESHIELDSEYIPDDRYHPWPDFMNKNNPNWADARDPFPGLNLRWVPGPGQKTITWEKRPKSWDDLK